MEEIEKFKDITDLRRLVNRVEKLNDEYKSLWQEQNPQQIENPQNEVWPKF